MQTTKEIIANMLTENTGQHMLDSGGAYGRNFERNQSRDFEAESWGSVEFSQYNGKLDVAATLNVYHWLAERLEYAPEIQTQFDQFVSQDDERRSHSIGDMEDFVAELGGLGIYGEGNPITVNTYNHECLLSQTLQYIYWEIDDEAFVLLQIHGGCDVRGGYTLARAFAVIGDEMAFFDDANCYLYADDETRLKDDKTLRLFDEDPQNEQKQISLGHWFTDDAFTFYNEETNASLRDVEVTDDPELRGKGVIYLDEKIGAAYCPFTGGKLILS